MITVKLGQPASPSLGEQVLSRLRRTEITANLQGRLVMSETARLLPSAFQQKLMAKIQDKLAYKPTSSSFGTVLITSDNPNEVAAKLRGLGWSTLEYKMRNIRLVVSREHKYPLIVFWNGKNTEIMAMGVDKV